MALSQGRSDHTTIILLSIFEIFFNLVIEEIILCMNSAEK